jgi:transcriptional regulator with AAA-type ATPase domain
MRRVVTQIERIAFSETHICIYGETGTGKKACRSHPAQEKPALLRQLRHAQLRPRSLIPSPSPPRLD